MTPIQWDAEMKLPWRDRLLVVECEAREFLDNAPFEEFTTTQLVDGLYPSEHARGEEAMDARKRIYDAFKTKRLPTHGMADCCHRGALRKTSFGQHRPWIWHAPTGQRNAEAVEFKAIMCPHCGGHFNANHT